MKAQLLHEHDGQRTFAVIFATGDEVMTRLVEFARQHHLCASHFSAIGAFERVTIAYFDWETKQYRNIAVPDQVEVLALSGDIALENDAPKIHAHVVLGKADGTAHGGHLVDGYVRPTLEAIVVESPAYLRRQIDAETGLALITPPPGDV